MFLSGTTIFARFINGLLNGMEVVSRFFRFDGELDRSGSRFGAEVIHTSFETFTPSVHMHSAETFLRRMRDEQVETLTLADESATVGGLVDENLLRNFPGSFVDIFNVKRDRVDILDGTIVGDDEVFHFFIP